VGGFLQPSFPVVTVLVVLAVLVVAAAVVVLVAEVNYVAITCVGNAPDQIVVTTMEMAAFHKTSIGLLIDPLPTEAAVAVVGKERETDAEKSVETSRYIYIYTHKAFVCEREMERARGGGSCQSSVFVSEIVPALAVTPLY
jgi:hypothetical protein